MPKKSFEYDLIYHIPATDTFWPKKHNIAYRTETHMVTYPVRIKDTYNADLKPVLSILKQDGWNIAETKNGFLCEKEAVKIEYQLMEVK